MAISLSTNVESYESPASVRLGGLTLYAPNETLLEKQLTLLTNAIENCATEHLSLVRNTLNSEVRKITGVEVDKRVFGAVLGSVLRTGKIDSVPIAAASGKAFRALVHAKNIKTFEEAIDAVAVLLRGKKHLGVRDVEELLFKQRQWGTWSSASHVLARLVYLGRACYIDDKHFRWPTEIDDAIKHFVK